MLHHEGSLLQTRASFSNVSQILTLLRFHCWQCRYKAYLHMMRTTTRPAHCLNRHAQNKTFLQTTVITCWNDSSASNFSTRYFISSFYQLLKWYVSWEYMIIWIQFKKTSIVLVSVTGRCAPPRPRLVTPLTLITNIHTERRNEQYHRVGLQTLVRLCVFGGRGRRTRTLCIRRTPMVIFCCLTVFEDWYTVVTLLVQSW